MYKIEPNSIELWAIEVEKEFQKSQVPFNDEQMNAFVTCFMNKEKMDNDKDLVEKLEKNSWGYPPCFTIG